MNYSATLIALAQYLVGEFDNKEQAINDPAWYVHLRLWQRPLPHFFDQGIAIFAEQANALYLDQPYRSRIMHLYENPYDPNILWVQYYMISNLEAVKGAGSQPEMLKQIRPDQVQLLPGCLLRVTYQTLALSAVEVLTPNLYRFRGSLVPGQPCQFTYQNQNFQVDLGFEVTDKELLSYDKGINPKTGQAIWGALLGPFRFVKQTDFATEVLA